MRLVILSWIWCLSVQANASNIRQLLAKPPPWDKQQLARMIGADILQSFAGALPKKVVGELFAGFDDSVYEKNAIPKIMKAIDELITQETPEITQPLIWQLVDPWGGQHKLFATIHTLKLDQFSNEAQQRLMKAIDEATLLMSEGGTGSGDSLDGVLARLGSEQGKEVVAFDSVTDLAHDTQNSLAQIISSMPTTREEFISFLDDHVDRLEFAYHLNANYFKGNHQALQQLEINEKILPKEMIDGLLTSRNEKFVKKIIDYCKRGEQCFILMGAMHTITTEQLTSVITLLQKQGFTVNFLKK